MRVSDKEREEHELTHTSFRSWCPYFERARGRNTSHLKDLGINKDKSSEVPRMSMDNFFMSQEDEKASANPVMVMVDERTSEKYARAVTKAWARTRTSSGSSKTCRTKVWGAPVVIAGNIILKSEGKPAFLAVRVPWRHSRTRRASCR